MTDLDAARTTLPAHGHDPLCPKWMFGGCFCELIRETRADERERIAAAIEAQRMHNPVSGWAAAQYNDGLNTAARIAREADQ